jgi:hypothetical protein
MDNWLHIKAPPHDDIDWIAIEAHIIRNSDGVERVYKTQDILNPEDNGVFDPFMWQDGNYACDCNRYSFFQRALNESEDDEVPCSDDKYTVYIVNPKTNGIVYDERKQHG